MLLETLLPVLGILAEPLSLVIVGVGGRRLSLLPGSHTEAGLREKGTRKAELWSQNYFTRAGNVPVIRKFQLRSQIVYLFLVCAFSAHHFNPF